MKKFKVTHSYRESALLQDTNDLLLTADYWGLFYFSFLMAVLLLALDTISCNTCIAIGVTVTDAFKSGITTMITCGGHFLKMRFLPRTSKIRGWAINRI